MADSPAPLSILQRALCKPLHFQGAKQSANLIGGSTMQKYETLITEHDHLDMLAERLSLTVGGRPDVEAAVHARSSLSMALNDHIEREDRRLYDGLIRRWFSGGCGALPRKLRRSRRLLGCVSARLGCGLHRDRLGQLRGRNRHDDGTAARPHRGGEWPSLPACAPPRSHPPALDGLSREEWVATSPIVSRD
jgi:hypothetical protein